MERRTQLIPQINPETRNWTSRVTVTEVISTMICENGTKLRRYIFTDSEGNEVAALVYGSDIEYLNHILQQYNVLDVTNAQVTYVEREYYHILKNKHQWRLGRQTLICHIPDAEPTLLYFLDNLTPFSIIDESFKTRNISIDIMGVVIAADEFKPTNYHSANNNQFQRFTFVNNERKPMVVTVWDPILTEHRDSLMKAIENSHIVVAKRLRVSTFDGISLATRNSSSLTFNPPLEPATQLKTWFDSLSDDDMSNLRCNQSIAISTELVRRGGMKIYSVAEVEKAVESRDYWVRGLLQLPNEDQKFFYVGCSNCYSKINVDAGVSYQCIACKKYVVSSFRPIVAMLVSDDTDTIKVIAVQNTAERIIQSTAEKLSQLKDLGQTYEIESLRTEFEETFMMLLRRSFSKRQDGQRRLLLIEYFEDTGLTSGNQLTNFAQSSQSNFSSPESTEKVRANEYSLSPLKRQMSEIQISSVGSAKKQLLMMSNALNTDYQPTDDQNNS